MGLSFVQTLVGNAKYRYVDMTNTHTEESIQSYETKQEDASIKANLLTESNKLRLVEENLSQLQEMQREFCDESETIVDAAAKFVKFLNENAAVLSEDAFQKYIEQSLDA